MALFKFEIVFTRKQIEVTKHQATVYAQNELEALHLLKQKMQDFWAYLDKDVQQDRGFLTQGRKYNAKPRVEAVKAL